MARAVVDTFIAATPEAVWSVLADFDAYPQWNPFVTAIDTGATFDSGTTWHVTRLGGSGRPATVDVVLDTWRPCREFAWLGHSGRRWQLSGRHSFIVTPHDDGTMFSQAEHFRGLWAWTKRGELKAAMRAQFGRMNDALRETVESKGGSGTR